jgi:hypothetical protein
MPLLSLAVFPPASIHLFFSLASELIAARRPPEAGEEKAYRPIPVIRKIDSVIVQRNYNQIRKEVQEIVHADFNRMMNDPELERLVVIKK